MKNEPEFLERIIQDSESVLKELEGLQQPEHIPPAEQRPGPAGNAGAVPVEDGRFTLEVSEDRMTAMASFFPPSEGGKPIAVEEVEGLLQTRGVRLGLDVKALRDAVLICNTELTAVSDLVLARGSPPRDEIAEHLVVEEGLLARKTPAEGAKIDFRELSPFVMVQKGQVLARVMPRQEGLMGSDVTGAALPYGKRAVSHPRSGKNTRREGQTVVADCDGRFVLSAQSFDVSEVLAVGGDVDYSTGHVSFPGDVMIGGEIKRGFKVSAGGALFCRKLIDATEVRCGKDLETVLGIVGRKDGVVLVGGKVRAKFIENCRVEAGGEIRVETGILNSSVYTLDRLETGPKGVLIGGVACAVNGVSVQQLGSPSGTRTEVHCGIDYSVQRKLEWIRDRNIALVMKLKAVQGQMKAAGPAHPRLAELEVRLREGIHKLNNAAQSLVGGLDKNEEAAVEVRGSAFSGCFIEICHVPFVVQREMKRVRLTLDKEKGKVTAGPL